MSSEPLTRLVAELLIAASTLSGYPLPEKTPVIVQLSHERLEQMACGRPCRVFGWSPPGMIIYLDDRLDLDRELFARSILVHELTHFLQQESGKFGARFNCIEWMEREREAYLVQYRWLAREQGAPVQTPGLVTAPWLVSCEDSRDDRNASLGG